jgi:hypothetical protein
LHGFLPTRAQRQRLRLFKFKATAVTIAGASIRTGGAIRPASYKVAIEPETTA